MTSESARAKNEGDVLETALKHMKTEAEAAKVKSSTI
jgi:hypothetical protein